MLPALRECAPTLRPHRPTLTATASPPEADAAQPVAGDLWRVLPQAEGLDGYVVVHRGIFAGVPRKW